MYPKKVISLSKQKKNGEKTKTPDATKISNVYLKTTVAKERAKCLKNSETLPYLFIRIDYTISGKLPLIRAISTRSSKRSVSNN